MEKIKEITLPKGWLVDKVENGKVILKENNTKPVIKWNKEKDGVEVKADGYHFIVANIPDVITNWDKAKILCEKLGGYLPSIKELKVIVKYIKEINQCFEDNNSPLCLLAVNYYYWSNSEYSGSSARFVCASNGCVSNRHKANDADVRVLRYL